MNKNYKEVPVYQCYKQVKAFKIGDISFLVDITPEDRDILPVKVDSSFMGKHQPDIGGYFVMYEDGYQSFSPAKAFESGYSLVEDIIKELEPIKDSSIDLRMLCVQRACEAIPRSPECGDVIELAEKIYKFVKDGIK